MSILVTGCSGFIGRHLVPELLLSDHVEGIDIQPFVALKHTPGKPLFQCFHADIRDEDAMAKFSAGQSAIVHLAAIASPNIAAQNPDVAWSTNARGTYNVLQLAKRCGIRRVIFLSSAHVYGISPKYFPTDENHPLALHDLYTSTKIMGEQICELFYRNHGISYTTLRLFNAYGPGQSEDYFIGAKMKQARAGGPVTLRNGATTKDWVHVSDVVDAIVCALKTEYVGPLNIGTGADVSLDDIATIIAQHHNVPLAREVGGDPPTRMVCNPCRAVATIGWKPTIPLLAGLKDLMR